MMFKNYLEKVVAFHHVFSLFVIVVIWLFMYVKRPTLVYADVLSRAASW